MDIIEDWKYEVSNGDTRLGFEEWAVHRLETQTRMPLPGETHSGATVIGSVWGTDTSGDTDDGSIFYYLLMLNGAGTFDVGIETYRLDGSVTQELLGNYDNIVEATARFKEEAGL